MAVGLGLLLALPAWAEWDVPQLMQQLAKHPSGRARFTETKTLAVLDKPVVSTGEMRFTPPDRLEKITLTPKPERMVLERDRVSLTRGNQTREVRLQDHPEVRSFVEAIRGALLGNEALLQKHYQLKLIGSEQDWRLMLVPLDARTFDWVRQITISGSRNVVSSIETLQADGDKSLLAIVPLDKR